ncbi:MAG: hypothetical protein ACYCQI_09945 [Gammaproteobacteria bacterium]
MLVRTFLRRFTITRLLPITTPALKVAVKPRRPLQLTKGMRSLHALTAQSSAPFLTYIKKNTKIPEFLNSIDLSDPRINQLRKAIEAGNDQDDIFSDPDCHLILWHLIKEKLISLDEGLTVHVYLMALMQSMTKQALKSEDLSLKFETPVQVDKLVSNGELTSFSKHYLSEICKQFAKFGFHVNYDKLAQFVLNLPATEQWALRLRYDRVRSNLFLFAVVVNTPFLYEQTTSPEDTYKKNYWIPSTKIIKYLIETVSSEPLQEMPIYGSIGPRTLLDIHQRNQHPLPLYSPLVKTNSLTVHGNSTCGPVAVLLHDWGHIFWASMLKKEERDIIYRNIIPNLIFLKKEASIYHNDHRIVAAIKELIDIVHDFDLTPVKNYIDPRTRFTNYLQSIFKVDRLESFRSYWRMHDDDEPSFIGSAPQDGLLFLVSRLTQNHHLPIEARDIWNQIAEIFNKDCRTFLRRDKIVDAIVNAAKDNMTPCDTQDSSVAIPDWKVWLELVTNTADSQELWNQVRTKHHDDLLTLSRCYQLNFFHPYLPMTEERRKMFTDFFQKKITQQADHQNRIKPVELPGCADQVRRNSAALR